jgi:hypothetical protein
MNLVVVKWEGRPISQQTMTTNGMLVACNSPTMKDEIWLARGASVEIR